VPQHILHSEMDEDKWYGLRTAGSLYLVTSMIDHNVSILFTQNASA